MNETIVGQVPPSQIVHEAAQSAARHTGPTADRWSTALERYLQFVTRPAPTPPGDDAGTVHDIPPRTVADVLCRTTPAAVASTPFRELARALQDVPSGAVPVLDADDHVIGVVSVSDLLVHVTADQTPDAPGRSGHRSHGHKRRKQHGMTAGELMTAPAVTVSPHTSIAEAARLAARHRVRSLPVVDEAGRLIGTVSRADMMRLFLRDDDVLRREVLRHVVRPSEQREHAGVTVTVAEGVVTLRGAVRTAMTAARLGYGAGQVPGVLAVHNELEYAVDDSGLLASGGPIFHP